MSGGRNDDDRVNKIRDIISNNARQEPSAGHTQSATGLVNTVGDGTVVNLNGNMNNHFGDNHYYGIAPPSSKGTKGTQYAPGTIGANGAYRTRIEDLLKEIEAFRKERFGANFRYGVIYSELKKAFGIKEKYNGAWKEILKRPEFVGEEVIDWLMEKRNNTMQGRIEKAASREGYKHTRGHLFSQQKEYLITLAWSEVFMREQMVRITGTSSRSKMNDTTLRAWVGYLEQEVRRLVD